MDTPEWMTAISSREIEGAGPLRASARGGAPMPMRACSSAPVTTIKRRRRAEGHMPPHCSVNANGHSASPSPALSTHHHPSLAEAHSRLRGRHWMMERMPKRMKIRLQILNAKPAGVTRTGNLLDTAPMEGVNKPGPVTALVKMKTA